MPSRISFLPAKVNSSGEHKRQTGFFDENGRIAIRVVTTTKEIGLHISVNQRKQTNKTRLDKYLRGNSTAAQAKVLNRM